MQCRSYYLMLFWLGVYTSVVIMLIAFVCIKINSPNNKLTYAVIASYKITQNEFVPPPSPPKKESITLFAQQPINITASTSNTYTYGYCTWYVKNRRPDLSNNLGNASTWFYRAQAQGMLTGTAPKVGAIGQRRNHVVYVENINHDGTITISEMNHRAVGIKSTRTLPASYFRYIY